MFKIHEIKNAHRRGQNAKKVPTFSVQQLFLKRAEERTTPYFSIVREQFILDERINKLTRHERGDFLLLCIDVWGEGVRFSNYPQGNAERMGMTIEEWEAFQSTLVGLKLLIPDDRGTYLVQPELREQYLQFIVGNSPPSSLDNSTEQLEREENQDV